MDVFQRNITGGKIQQKKRHLDTTDKHPKQTLQSVEVSLSQDSKGTVLFLFSNEQQPFHFKQAVEYAPHHLQQLPAGHLPQSSCCFTCAAVKHHMVPNEYIPSVHLPPLLKLRSLCFQLFCISTPVFRAE